MTPLPGSRCEGRIANDNEPYKPGTFGVPVLGLSAVSQARRRPGRNPEAPGTNAPVSLRTVSGAAGRGELLAPVTGQVRLDLRPELDLSGRFLGLPSRCALSERFEPDVWGFMGLAGSQLRALCRRWGMGSRVRLRRRSWPRSTAGGAAWASRVDSPRGLVEIDTQMSTLAKCRLAFGPAGAERGVERGSSPDLGLRANQHDHRRPPPRP